MLDIGCFRQYVPSLVNLICQLAVQKFHFIFSFVSKVSFLSISEKAFLRQRCFCTTKRDQVILEGLRNARSSSDFLPRLVCSTSAHACKPRSLRTSPWSTTAPSRPCLRRKSLSSELWLAASQPTHLYHYLPREGCQRCVK